MTTLLYQFGMSWLLLNMAYAALMLWVLPGDNRDDDLEDQP